MRFRTEDLLSLRDGEPVDAAVKARALADPKALRALEVLARQKRALEALPELAPAPDARARVLAAMRAAAARRPVRRTGRVLLAAAAAGAAAAVLLLMEAPVPVTPAGPQTLARGPQAAPPAVEPEPSPEPQLPPAPRIGAPEEYLALLEESARLERSLFALPAQRPVMTAGTAGTIATLEGQIAHIDSELSLATAAGAEDEYREVLWRERVEVMNALLQVRYAQSQLFEF